MVVVVVVSNRNLSEPSCLRAVAARTQLLEVLPIVITSHGQRFYVVHQDRRSYPSRLTASHHPILLVDSVPISHAIAVTSGVLSQKGLSKFPPGVAVAVAVSARLE